MQLALKQGCGASNVSWTKDEVSDMILCQYAMFHYARFSSMDNTQPQPFGPQNCPRDLES